LQGSANKIVKTFFPFEDLIEIPARSWGMQTLTLAIRINYKQVTFTRRNLLLSGITVDEATKSTSLQKNVITEK